MLTLILKDPKIFILLLPVLLLSLTVHEVSHGYAAFKCGDTTAKDMGRLNLNPLAHLDLTGALMMLIVGFGWAKPVPVNPRNFKKPKRDMALVALAGPVSNILMCFVSVLLYYLAIILFGGGLMLKLFYSFYDISILTIDQTYFFGTLMEQAGLPVLTDLQCCILQVLGLSAMLNAGLAVFNLIPIPPLDGSKILAGVLPSKAAYRYLMLERYIRYALMLLIVINLASSYVPALSVISEYVFFPVTFLREGLLWLFELPMKMLL